MNKKFLSAILFGALMVTATGTFVSCKDYDDDIDRIDKELTDLKSQIAALQTAVDNGKWITDVTPTSDGLTITMNDGKTFNITNGTNGAQGEKGEDGSQLTLDAEGQWLINDEPTGWYCAKKGETATVIVPEVGKDGYWYFVNKETGKLEKSDYKAAPVTAVEANGICTLTVVNPDGTTTVVKLPTAAASITEIEFVGYTEADGTFKSFGVDAEHNENNNTYASLPYTAKYFESKKEVKWPATDEGYPEFKFTIPAETTISAFGGRSLIVRFAPASADATALDLALMNSKMEKATVNFGEVAPFKGLVTRAESANGLWKLPVLGGDNSMKEDAFNGQFSTSTGKQVGFALQAGQFISNFDLLFKKEDLTATQINFNNEENVSNITDATKAPLIKLNEDNSFEFTKPSSVYKYQLAFRAADIKNWGITYDGLSFKVGKFYDKATVPAIPVKLYYYDLGNETMQQTLNYYVRLEKNIADLVTLDAKAHTINAVKADDKFEQSLEKMYTALGDEVVNWKDDVNSAVVTVWQVAGNPDGSDKAITTDLTKAGIVLSIIDSDNETAYTSAATTANGKLAKAAKVNVNLAHSWPVDKDGKAIFGFNKEYYVNIDFKYKDEVEGTLNSVRLPFTVGVPALSTFLEKQKGVFNGTSDGLAYIFSSTYNVKNNTVAAMQYDLTYGFVKLAEKLKPSESAVATTLKFKTNGYINGDDKNSEGVIVGIAAVPDSKAVELTPSVTAVDATKAILIANKDKNAKVYGQKFVIEVTDAKYVSKYAYSSDDMKAQKFTITMKSPIKEGSISAADGTTTISVDATNNIKIGESKFLAKTYSTAGTKYQLFPSEETKASSNIYDWIKYSSEDAKGTISITSDDTKVLTVDEIINGTDASGDTKAVEGYVKVTPINPGYNTEGNIIVKVKDVWGFEISQKIKVNIVK